jgi:hypothetical protein
VTTINALETIVTTSVMTATASNTVVGQELRGDPVAIDTTLAPEHTTQPVTTLRDEAASRMATKSGAEPGQSA